MKKGISVLILITITLALYLYAQKEIKGCIDSTLIENNIYDCNMYGDHGKEESCEWLLANNIPKGHVIDIKKSSNECLTPSNISNYLTVRASNRD